MIDIAEPSVKLEAQLKNHTLLRDFKVIERAEVLNVDASITPWVGIYQDNVEFEAYTLGRGAQNWRALVNIDIVVQVHGDGGAKAEAKLGDAVKRVIVALLSDLTIGGSVDMINRFTVNRAYVRTETKTLDFQHAIIALQVEVRTGDSYP